MYCPTHSSRFSVNGPFSPNTSQSNKSEHTHTHTYTIACRAEGPQVGKGGIFTRLAPQSPFSTVHSKAAGHQHKAGSVCTQWATH